MKTFVAMVTKLAMAAILDAAPPPGIDYYDIKSSNFNINP